MPERCLDVELIFQDESEAKVMSSLQEADARDVSKRQEEGFTGIEIAIFGTVLARLLVGLIGRLVRLWKCGVVIDARKPKLVVEKNCELPRGAVLILSADGTQATLHEPSEEQLKVKLGNLIDATA
jgi:hypothetical protein